MGLRDTYGAEGALMGLRVHLWGCAYGPEGHIWGRRDTLMGQRGTYGAEEALMGLGVHLWG